MTYQPIDVPGMIAQRRLDEPVPTNSATVRAALPSSYYAGPKLQAVGSIQGSVMSKMQGYKQGSDAAQAYASQMLAQRQQEQQKAANLKLAQSNKQLAQQAIDASKGQSYNLSFTPQKINITLPNGAPSSQWSYGNGTSGSYKVTGNHANTSGAANAIGGNYGAGTYKYVYNENLDASRNKVLGLATSYLGSTYKLGGTSRTGIDCSGLVMAVYSQLGYSIPMHSATWQKNNIPGVRVAFNRLAPGDIVAWKDGSHIAIYAGNGKIIESTETNSGISRGTLYRDLWDSPDNVVGIHLTLPGEK